MTNDKGTVSCAVGCWLVAILGGILAAILLGLLGSWTFLQAVFAGLVIAAIAGALLSWVLCKPLPALNSASEASGSGADANASSAGAAASAEAVTAPPPAAAAAAASAGAATATAAKTDDAADADKAKAAAKAEADAAAKAKADAKAKSDAEAKAKTAAASAAPTTASSAPEAVKVKPSKPLPGEAELAERKGSWKYEGDAAPAAKPGKAPAKAKPKSEAAPKKVTNPAPAEGGKAPETLSAAREGGPDDLKQIKGVGPKLEGVLHSMGFYHFDQIAAWGADEIAWADQNLVGFKGRVSRDDWVPQAKTLAAGGTTEFSKKVKKGGVY